MVPKRKYSICRADRLRSPSAFRRKSLKTARSTFAAHAVCLVKARDIVAATITNIRNASTIARVPVVVRTGRREINQASILQSEAFAASVSAIVKAAIESSGLGKAYPRLSDHFPESSSQSSETLGGTQDKGGSPYLEELLPSAQQAQNWQENFCSVASQQDFASQCWGPSPPTS